MEALQIRKRLAVTAEEKAQVQYDYQNVVLSAGVNPLSMFSGIAVQAPLFILFYFTLRNMAENNFDGFANGGALWFHNLCVADPYYVLPVFTTCVFLTTIEVNPPHDNK